MVASTRMTGVGVTHGEAAGAEAGGPPRRARWRWILGSVALVLVAIVGALVLLRKPVATHFIDEALRARGVTARYEIAQIGLHTQRLTNVRIGDPAHPDLLADWVEVDTSLWVSGASVTAIRVGKVQLRARLADGKVSFGAIDRLLPAPSGKPFALPAIYAEIGDAGIALATPYGPAALQVKGAGRLNDGFAGTLAARAARLDAAGCRLDATAAALSIRIVKARPSLAGPLSFSQAQCNGGSATGARAEVSVALSATLDHWKGSARLAVASLETPTARVRDMNGPIAFVGSAKDVSGTLDLQSGAFSASGATGLSAALTGKYRYAGGFAFDGTARARRVVPPQRLLVGLGQYRTVGAGTPVAPIAAKLVAATQAAARLIDVNADLSALIDGARGQVSVARLAIAAASGARASIAGGRGIRYRWPDGAVWIGGTATIAGGGLPDARTQLTQAAPGAALTGRAIVTAYDAGTARLALSPVDFSASPDGATRITTRAALSGPLGDGRVEALSLPIDARWDGASRLVVNAACAPLAFDRLRTAGLDLRRSAVTLCPLDGGLVRIERGALRGGGTVGPVRLAGTLGSAPVELVTRRAKWRLGEGRFALNDIAVRLGDETRRTRLDVGTLSGGFGRNGLQGRFAGASGQIGNVPLLLSGADGSWRFAAGKLALDGALTVADSATAPRFNPLAARSVTLSLIDNRIAATGTLFEPTHAVKVADVTIAHDLGAGTGRADLTVPGITFDERFQPRQLTELTYGVIADVAGSVNGEGHIRWTPQGVTSDGVFRTPGTDLAAGFGPATGIAGEIRFTDLLALETAPGQTLTIKSINPGVPVTDGVVRYHLLPNTRIAVEEGRWPFAGGTLTLEPTVLDFGEAQERRMTFRVAGVQAAQFLQQFDFKNLDATGVFDGTLPMVFDATGGRIDNGHLVVRPGGGTIAYVGEVTQKDVGFWGNFAFQALKSLRYRDLDVVMNGPLAGEIITEVRFAGIAQGAGAKRNFLLDRLQKLPIVFNLRIEAPFRQLIDSAQSFYDPKRLIERNLPTLLDEQNKRAPPPPVPPIAPPVSIQPSESRKMP
ncbi:YdbH domain-containing protein [Sphingomonas sp. MMS24-J45]|uniref:YdbH domain-containing protein n=1 Tax=Sphingomonas sp. MMS24-J45 TaxID=3238806 RepID=UPI00384FBFBB